MTSICHVCQRAHPPQPTILHFQMFQVLVRHKGLPLHFLIVGHSRPYLLMDIQLTISAEHKVCLPLLVYYIDTMTINSRLPTGIAQSPHSSRPSLAVPTHYGIGCSLRQSTNSWLSSTAVLYQPLQHQWHHRPSTVLSTHAITIHSSPAFPSNTLVKIIDALF